MVEETQALEIPEIMSQEITDSAGAIAYWEYIAAFVEQTFDPYLKHAQEVITMARDQGDSPADVIEQAELGLDAWRAPVARTMEMLSFLRGYDLPDGGLGPQYPGYDTASPHYNRVVQNKAAAILLCRNLYPIMEGADERYLLARERCLETADLLDKNSD